jgi:hypothetical protein
MTKYTDDPVSPEFLVKTPWSRAKIFACIFFVASCALGSWYYWEYHYLANKEIPLLTAEDGPTKIKPEKADGAIVPHMDKMVYESLKPGNDISRLVAIMPEPEQPINIAATNHKDPIEDIIGEILSPTKEEKVITTPESFEIIEKAPQASVKALTIIPVEKHSLQPKSTQQAKPLSAYKMQLVSVRTEAIALKEWERLKKMHNKSLGGLQYSLQKISTPGHGVFYRLLAGKFTTFGQAKAACKKLISAQQSCIVVKD